MSSEHRRRLMRDPRFPQLSRRQRDLLEYLALYAGDEGRLRWPMRTSRLAAELGYSPETIKRARRDLTAGGLIVADPLPEGHERQRGTVYTVALSFDRPLGDHPELPVPVVVDVAANVVELVSPDDVDERFAGWCAAARIRGARHVNRRCCATTIRQLAAAEAHARKRFAAIAQRKVQDERRAQTEAAKVAAADTYEASQEAREEARRIARAAAGRRGS